MPLPEPLPGGCGMHHCMPSRSHANSAALSGALPRDGRTGHMQLSVFRHWSTNGHKRTQTDTSRHKRLNAIPRLISAGGTETGRASLFRRTPSFADPPGLRSDGLEAKVEFRKQRQILVTRCRVPPLHQEVADRPIVAIKPQQFRSGALVQQQLYVIECPGL